VGIEVSHLKMGGTEATGFGLMHRFSNQLLSHGI